MIKAKTLKKALYTLAFSTLVVNQCYAGLIKPLPKPQEFKLQKQTQSVPKKTNQIEKKIISKDNSKKKAPLKETPKPKKKVTKKIKPQIKEQIKITKRGEPKIIKNDGNYSVTNLLLPVKKPNDLGINKKNSKILKQKDFIIAQKTFNLIKRKRWNSAIKEVEKSNSVLLTNLVRWMYLKEPSNRATFYDYAEFIEQKNNWPRINRLRYLAEHKIDFKNVKPKDVLKFFEKQEPFSGYGKIKLGEAYLINGEKNKAHDLIAEGFKTANLSRQEHRYLNKKFRKLLTTNDYIVRAEYLAWEQDFYELKRTIRYLPKDFKELYFARFALMTRSYGVDSAISKVPQKFINNVGLQFDRAKWRRKRGRYDGALEIINSLPDDPKYLVKPDLWFKEKFIIARRKIDKKQYKQAYDLMTDHGVVDSGNLAKAEWHAGWLALRFLNMPKQAVDHFSKMYEGVNYPISKSRAAFWLGEAYSKLGQNSTAKQWYGKAAEFNTTYYGQLAAAKIDKQKYRVKNNFTYSKDNFQKFLKQELVKAVILLDELDESQRAKDIIKHLGSEERSITDQIHAGLLAQKINRLDFGVQIAKQASYLNKNLLELNYPIIDTPKLVARQKILPQEVILALIRQESEFDDRANSWVGAKGLMQIMPATGRLVAKQAGLKYSKYKLVNDEYFNLQLGSFYISDLTQNLDGATYMAFAAYNAGPHRVKRWIRRFGDPRKGQISPIDWIELIPFSETRNYVQRVIENIQVYKYVINKKPVTNNIEKILF